MNAERRRSYADLTRRELLGNTSAGIGSAALGALLARDLPAATRPAHHAPRARSVIFLHMVGAPSQLDLFDPKPELDRRDGEMLPESLWKGLRLAFIRERPRLLATRYSFRRHGASGQPISELLPHLSGVADELAVIRSLHTEQFNHAPAQLLLQTGFERFGHPSLGSWVSYGLGSENEDLPAFVVLITGQVAGGGNALWGSGFLPTVHQGVEFRSRGDPVLFLSDPPGVSRADRKRIVETVQRLNAERLADVGDPAIATRIASYEMAFRMQISVPELMDISHEPPHIHALYGTEPGNPAAHPFANHCLLARRLVERGVRFVQLYNQKWDHHGNIFDLLPKKTKEIDRPVAALIADLKQRGLLEQTLVVWCAEFGRTPMVQGDNGEGKKHKPGRDHHKDAFCAWMAGGGVAGGIRYGETDDLGFHVTRDPMHVHDMQATILHLLGLDHKRLTFRVQGRDFRLTDVRGKVVGPLLA